MNNVCRRKRLKRRVAAFPVRAQVCIDSGEVAMGVGILHMAGEQSPAALEYLRGSGHTRSREDRGRDAALRRPTGMEELRLRAIHPAFQKSGGEAPRDTSGAGHGFRIQSQ